MRRHRGQHGLTLLELVVSLAIAALILPLVGGIVFMLQFFPGRTQADIQAQQDMQTVGQWITIDANRADRFSPPALDPNAYGVFSWTEYGGNSPVSVEVAYFYDAETTSLMRRVTRDNVLDRESAVARNIASFDEVTFDSVQPSFELEPATGLFRFIPGRVTVTPITTVEKINQEPARLSNMVIAELRAQFTNEMAPPGPEPPPPKRRPKPKPPSPAPTTEPPVIEPPSPPPPPAGGWIPLADTPAKVKAGGAITSDGTNLYALRGGDKDDLWRWDVSAGTWVTLDQTPDDIKRGAALIHANGFIYAFIGDGEKDFWRYNINGDRWESREEAPDDVGRGGFLAWDGSDTVYALRGDNKDGFWRYSIANNSWDDLADTPRNVRSGGSLVFAGGALYALRGFNRTSFWKYNVGADSWESLADTPGTVEEGGTVTWDGADHLYALRGGDTTGFWRYTISEDGWEILPETPEEVKDGGGLAFLNGALYALRGDDTRDFWKFITEPDTGPEPTPVPPPTASIISPTSASTHLTTDSITFSGAATDGAGADLPSESLVWTSSLDGQVGAGETFNASLTEGSHTITLTATDSLGTSAIATAIVTINRPGAPTVSVTTPQSGSTHFTIDTITFSGTATNFEDVDIPNASLVWTSDLVGTIGAGALVSATLSAGTHTITLTATDRLGVSASATVTITVNTPNAPAVAITSPPAGSTHSTIDNITFGGAATDFEGAVILDASPVWTSNLTGQFEVGPSGSASLGAGVHTITDRLGVSGAASVTITVNSPPIVSITSPANGSTHLTTGSISFGASAIDLEDGALSDASLVWSSSLSGQIGTGDSLSASMGVGVHTITLAATDSLGVSVSASVTITVSSPPTVSIASPAEGSSHLTTDSITFSGSAIDFENTVISDASLVWSSNLSGPIGTGASLGASLSPGSHTVTLTATDGLGIQSTASVTIAVNSPDAPTVSITSPANGTTHLTADSITFIGSATDFAGAVIPDASFDWTSNRDGQIGSGPSVSASLSAGVHTITLTATDRLGVNSTASVTITLNTPDAPIVAITSPADGSTHLTVDGIAFSGSATDFENAVLSDVSLVWTSSMDGRIGTGVSLTASLTEGSHTITLTATDRLGISVSDSVTIALDSPDAPTVAITNPQNGSTHLTVDSISFSGSATAFANAVLSGSSMMWDSSRDGQIGAGASINASLTAGSHTVTLTATDRLGVQAAASVNISVGVPDAPTVSISSPGNASTHLTTDTITFRGSAASFENVAISGNSLVWTSSLDGQIGAGPSLRASLGAGSHAITLTATDRLGAQATASVTISVNLPDAPAVSITSPANGSTHLTIDAIGFDGSASDFENAVIPDTSLVWTSSLDGQIGAGGSFNFSLSAGVHTVTFVATDRLGVQGSASVTVNVERPDEPTVSVTSPTNNSAHLTTDSITFSGSATDFENIAMSGNSLVWTSSLDGPIGTGSSFNASLNPGGHTITLTATDRLGIQVTDSVIISVNAPPSVSIDSPGNGSTHLTVDSLVFSASVTDIEDVALSGASLVWTSDLVGQIGVGASFNTSLSPGSHTITFTAKDSLGASSSGSVTITVNTPDGPTASIAGPTTGSTYNASDTIPFTGSASDFEGAAIAGASLVWTSSLVGQIGTGESFNTLLTPGSHTITLAAIDKLGASGSSFVTITVNSPPTVSIISPADGSTHLTADSIPFNGAAADSEDFVIPAASLVWTSSAAGQIGSGASIDATLTSGSHTITLTATDSQGASSTASITIAVNPPDAPAVSIATPVNGSTHVTTGAISFGGSATDFEGVAISDASLVWTSSLAGEIGAGASLNVSLTAGSHTITLTATDRLGIQGTASVTITVNPPPTVSITSPVEGSTHLTTGSITFNGAASDFDGAAIADGSLAWTSSLAGQLGTGASVSADLGSGAHTITLTATDGLGVQSEASATITVNTPPNVSITSPADGSTHLTIDDITFNASVTDLEDVSVPGSSLAWTSSLGGPIGSGASITGSLPTGVHTITLTATDSQGATVSDSVVITINPPGAPTVFITSPANGSTHSTIDAITLSGSATDFENSVISGSSLVWTSSVAGQIGDGASVSTALGAGVHIITLLATDRLGASGTASVPVTVNTPPNVSIDNPANGSTHLTTDNIAFSGTASDLEDVVIDDSSLTWTSSLTGSIGAGASVTTALAAGVHTVTLTAIDSQGASVSASIAVTVNTPPTVSTTSPTGGSSHLTTDSINFSGSGIDFEDVFIPDASLVWTSSLVGQIGIGESFDTSLTPGSHTVTLTVTDSQGASASASVIVTVNTPPTASIVSPTNGSSHLTTGDIAFNGSGGDFEDVVIPGASLVWTSSLTGPIGIGASFSDALAPGSHTITLTVTDSQGAMDTASVIVTVNTPPVVSIIRPADGSSFPDTGAIAFSGSANDAEDGVLTGGSLAWVSSVAGQIGSGASINASLTAGSHTITLTATDSQGASTSDSATITVTAPPPNSPPLVFITSPANGSGFLSTGPVSFSGFSTDVEDVFIPDGSLVWTSSLGGQIGTGDSFSATLAAGAHTVTLTATDSQGEEGTASISITVNSPPTASIASPVSGSSHLTNANIPFSGTAFDFEDGVLAGDSLVWTSLLTTLTEQDEEDSDDDGDDEDSDDDGDGDDNDDQGDGEETLLQLGTGVSFQAFLAAGSHAITLTATDSQGIQDTSSVTITVTTPPPSIWLARADTPDDVDDGGAITSDGVHLYALRGDNKKDFWKFDTVTGSWSELEDTPEKVKDGGALTYGNGVIYAFRGGKKKDFWKFDVETGDWSTLAAAPDKVKSGGSLVYLNGLVYALRGDKKRDFWRYDVNSNSWVTLTETPEKVKSGGSLTTDGTGIYAFRGDEKKDFWRYSISDDVWTELDDAPSKVGKGGSLASDGSIIFALRGSKEKDFWRYVPNTGEWSELPDVPSKVDGGGSLVVVNGTVYALRGDDEADLWKY